MNEFLIFVLIWILGSLILAFLFVTKHIGSAAVVGWVALALGAGMVWFAHAGDRIAAEKWRDGGFQAAMACAHSAECIRWLRYEPPAGSIELPGQAVWLAVCGDTSARELFGKAVPCSPPREPRE